MNQKLIIGNLKMRLSSPAEKERYFGEWIKALKNKDLSGVELVVCPPVIFLESFAKEAKKMRTKVGAQNMFFEKEGAYTGEISPVMIKNCGGEYVIVGHSERRNYFFEDNEVINAKLKSALKNNLIPIFCVGESRDERAAGLMKKVIVDQLAGGLEGIIGSKVANIIIVYEPVWAVGTDVFPTADEIMEARILIRKILGEKYGLKQAQKVRILYGGSVNAKMTKQVCLDPGMDGVLVGRESLIPSEFLKIAEIINNG